MCGKVPKCVKKCRTILPFSWCPLVSSELSSVLLICTSYFLWWGGGGLRSLLVPKEVLRPSKLETELKMSCRGRSKNFRPVSKNREWPRYCRKVCWTKMVQNGPNDHFGQNGRIPNWILAFARPKWTKMVHFGPFWPEEVHFGPFFGPPTVLWPFNSWKRVKKSGIDWGVSLFWETDFFCATTGADASRRSTGRNQYW